jgi:hypothetical protein
LMELALQGSVAVFVPRHALAVEVRKVIERSLAELGRAVEVPILRGRDHDAKKGRAPCRRWREARTLGENGLPVYSNLRQRRRGDLLGARISGTANISARGAAPPMRRL